MMEDVEGGKRKRWRLWLALTALVVLLAVVLVPPMVSINRYKNDITHLVSESLGRPVRLSSVELRLIPRPGFVLTDLTVDEDPAYGAEPVLRANAVKASIRLFSLWRGRLEISRISVDEASINLVRTAEGRWNLESLFRTAAGKVQNAEAAQANPNRRVNPFPYIEATNSRINFKEGVEKLPFSLLNTDLSFWQEQPGEWRIRVRGQPARTDVNLDLADTGVVRLEASIHRAAELRNLPVHLDVDWQNAQLGQLTRLLIGSDSGWRGDLTGEMHLDGTAEAAQIQTRLRATGVHREEFAPAAPMDFDASCGLVYGNETPAHFSVELDQIPVGAALDALRTVRNDFAPGLQAAGLVSGKIGYAPQSADVATTAKTASKNPAPSTHGSRAHAQPAGPLTGSLTVQGFQLSGDGIGEPVQVPKVVLEAVSTAATLTQGDSMALQTSIALPAGAPSPLTISARLALSGYTVRLQGQTNTIRARELA
ncbi:MAG: AsmA family protein, partial [Terracidiphilus sp.]